MKRKTYKPLPARRVYIPKSKTEKRPLGIPALENKIVERGITWILEAIYEQDFLNCSYGFRPDRNAHQALKEINDLILFQPVNHLVEADIKGFFDNVSHELLMDFIRIRVKDTTLLELIEKFLKAGYIDEGVFVKSDKGTPQGSILSPILANIFLHNVLDTWFEDTVKNHVRGFCEIVRYADDFVFVSSDRSELLSCLPKIAGFLYGSLDLNIQPDKVFIKTLASGVDFLGWVHFPHHRVLRTKTRRRMFKQIRRKPEEATLQSYLGILDYGNAHQLAEDIQNHIWVCG